MRASSRASSSPKCAIASSCEWSIVSPTIPALRPLAPYPAVLFSRTQTESDGSSSLRNRAVQSPVNPAPTTATSAATSPASRVAARGGREAIQ